MTRKYFGTDGVRGTVGESPMTPDFVLRLGYAAGRVLSGREGHPSVLIGKDTRISGYMIESALEAGFSAAGVDVHMCGPVPTPAVAYLTRALRLSAGVVISASHNPYPDNGMKVVVDCAHGAAYHVAPNVFHELGADSTAIGARPDGFNINDNFGATAP